jgi:hypothetical protein
MEKQINSETEDRLGGFSEEAIFQSGWHHAEGIPENNLELIHDGMDESEAEDIAFREWYEAEDNCRQYSPFEFSAKLLNDMEDSDRAWECFDAGITAAFRHYWEKIVLRDYSFQ